MQIEVPFPVGSDAWLWMPSVGREPVQVNVESISIWMEERHPDKIKFSYNLKHKQRIVMSDGTTLFTTHEEAETFRDKWLAML